MLHKNHSHIAQPPIPARLCCQFCQPYLEQRPCSRSRRQLRLPGRPMSLTDFRQSALQFQPSSAALRAEFKMSPNLATGTSPHFSACVQQQLLICNMKLLFPHVLTSIRAAQFFQRPRQRCRYRPQRNSQSLRDLTVAQPLCSHAKAGLVLLRQRAHHRLQSSLSLPGLQLFLRIWIPVCLLLRQSFVKVHRPPQSNLVCCALFQSQIARYAKNPAAKILPRFSAPQMLEQQQKRFLNNFFPIMHR